jgi:hypothetical protein
MNKRHLIVAAITASLAIGAAPAAMAAAASVTFVQSTGAPLASQTITGLNPNGDTVYLTLGNFPTGKGLYVYQAVQPAAGARPTQVNTASEQWVTTAMGGTAKPTDIIKVAVNNGHAWNADCAHQTCGIQIEFDHDSTTDKSQDQFFPIAFAATGTTPVATSAAAPSVTITAQIDGKDLSGTMPGALGYETPKYVVIKASDGEPTTASISADPSGKTFCVYSKNTIKALSATGACNLNITVGSGAQANFPFMLGAGIQTLTNKVTSIGRGKPVALAAKTNFGEATMYTSASAKVCAVVGETVIGLRPGSCVLNATAAASANYAALTTKVTIKVK